MKYASILLPLRAMTASAAEFAGTWKGSMEAPDCPPAIAP